MPQPRQHTEQIDTDYLIVGSGAVGMAFADILLSETDADIVIVDNHAAPGGHWNVAYPFVTLHQPSAFYGVSSTELSRGLRDESGLNQGLNDLASGAEVLAYFDHVMRHRFLPSGRVRYFTMCEFDVPDTGFSGDDGAFHSKITGQTYTVSARRKTVDATYLKTSVPATHTPNFGIAPGVRFVPLNDLPTLTEAPQGFVVVGGGKTGIDACLWLLAHGVDPDAIRWVMPRDAWLLDRENTQPSDDFFGSTVGALANQFEAAAAAESITDLFDRLEASGVLLRIDRNVRPRMFHGATVSKAELEQLRRIRNIVRLGRVQRIDADKIVLADGEIPTGPDQLHVDCSARAISNDVMIPVFADKLITPQTVRAYQPVFSAALIAHVEAAYASEKQKNQLCGVVPLPNHDTDWIRMLMGQMMNQFYWSQDKGMRDWLLANRLDSLSTMLKNAAKDDAPKQDIIRRMRSSVPGALAKLQQFMGEI